MFRPSLGHAQALKENQFKIFYYYYWYSALGPVWAETRVQSGDWYSSGTLHPGQVLRGSLPLLSPNHRFFTKTHCVIPNAHRML